MGKIYSINDLNIPSVEYLNDIIKKLQDIVVTHVNNHDSAHTIDDIKPINLFIDADIEQISSLGGRPSTVSIDDIKLDTNHRFVSDDQINILQNSITKQDYDEYASNFKSEIIKYVNKKFDQLLNSADVLSKLRILANILNEDDNIVGDLFQSTLENVNSKLEEHSHDGSHIAKEERIALDKLLKFIDCGCSDWDAPDDAPNCIKNKPEYLKANGGNADTVGGYKVNDLINHHIEKCILGFDNRATYNLTNNDCTGIINTILDQTNNGIIGFNEGVFIYSDECMILKGLSAGELVFKGAGKGTILDANTMKLLKNTCIKDMTIHNATVYVCNETKIQNVNFNKCKLVIDNCSLTRIMDSNFIDCEIAFEGSMTNCIVTNNISNSINFNYIGGSNIIANNINY